MSLSGWPRHLLFQNFDRWILAQLILPSEQVSDDQANIFDLVILIESEGSGLRVIQEMKPGGRSRYFIIEATLTCVTLKES